jgi:hypothetical protein
MAAPPIQGDDDGVAGYGVKGTSHKPNTKAVEGLSDFGVGVFGSANYRTAVGVHGVNGHFGIAVLGESAGGVAAVKGLQGTSGFLTDIDGVGVAGDSVSGRGVVGASSVSDGVLGLGSTSGVRGVSNAGIAVSGECTEGEGLRGTAHSFHSAIVGLNDTTTMTPIIEATLPKGGAAGVFGVSLYGEGVHGETNCQSHFVAGVSGVALHKEGFGPGAMGESFGQGPGVFGKAPNNCGVMGYHGSPDLRETTVSNWVGKAGVFGASSGGPGVLGYSTSADPDAPAMFAYGLLRVLPASGPRVCWFQGDVQVDGDIFLPGADCAEQFDVADQEDIEAGEVVVVDKEGALHKCREAYDRKVAGVVSGGGKFRTAIVLDRQQSLRKRLAVALVGKVYCNVDAKYSPIEVGDLLTTSPTPGHAMRAGDATRAFGAVIGKALAERLTGTGLLPVLVCLR